jgi:hypothetical protein
MIIRVVYHDNTCDTIPVHILQLGIDCKKIKMFYRYSEKRWITIGDDPVRATAQILALHTGPERRAPHSFQRPFFTEKGRILV